MFTGLFLIFSIPLGLNFSNISFQDNQHVIDLISKRPTGLLFILEEQGMMNRKPDDVALLNAFNTTHAIVTTPVSVVLVCACLCVCVSVCECV